MEIQKEIITPDESNNDEIRPPEPKKRSVNVLLILIVACWLIFLYIFGGIKGPG
jgi:hypothetical protein